MGSVLSELPISDTDKMMNISPQRADWLTSHADATGLAVVEVERLWNRFKQLTGSNEQTKLNPDASALPNELANDVFVKNLLKHFPRSRTDPNGIPFGYFITVIQWFETGSIDDKLRAIFIYLNNGDPIDVNMLAKLFKHLYRETPEDQIRPLAVQCMQQLGSNEYGKLNQQQFIAGVKQYISPAELDEILTFSIIPTNLLDEANMLPSLQSSSTNVRAAPVILPNQDFISDDQLRQIAQQSARKQWSRLALTLGFLEYDIEAYRVKNNGDSVGTMYDLLRIWREQEASLATKNRLKYCLQESGLEELIPILN